MIYRPLSIIPELTSNLFSDRFDRMDRLFSRLTGDEPLSDAPAYNLVQRDDTHYELTISVPGYQEDELEVSLQNNQLSVSGKQTETQKGTPENDKWLHHGISRRDFTLSFNLHNRIKVQSASLSLGLLKLTLEREIPEEEKPQRISIETNNQNRILEHKS